MFTTYELRQNFLRYTLKWIVALKPQSLYALIVINTKNTRSFILDK